MDEDENRTVTINMGLTPQADVYANIAMVASSPWDFTLDFFAMNPPTLQDGIASADAPLVARVRVPTTMIFQLAKAIATAVDEYERHSGPIQSGGPVPPKGNQP